MTNSRIDFIQTCLRNAESHYARWTGQTDPFQSASERRIALEAYIAAMREIADMANRTAGIAEIGLPAAIRDEEVEARWLSKPGNTRENMWKWKRVDRVF
jgi:hypothetical protein